MTTLSDKSFGFGLVCFYLILAALFFGGAWGIAYITNQPATIVCAAEPQQTDSGLRGHPREATKELLLDDGLYSEFAERNETASIVQSDYFGGRYDHSQTIVLEGKTGDQATIVIFPHPSRVRLAIDTEPVTATDYDLKGTDAIFRVHDVVAVRTTENGRHLVITKIPAEEAEATTE